MTFIGKMGSRAPAASRRRPRPERARRVLLRLLEQLEDRCLLSTLTVNGAQQLQTIAGFGTNLSSETWNGGAVTPSLDILLNHGYKLFRVLVEPVQGWEDTNPNTGQYSDSNPNWPYYDALYGTSTKFTDLWNTIRYLNSHGATVMLNLQSDAPAWMTDAGGLPGSIGPDHEADWATMVSTLMDYAVNVAHVRIDSLGPMNEEDNTNDPVQGPQVGAAQYVRMLDTLETQMQGYGLGYIPLVVADNADANNTRTSYAPAVLADPFLMAHVTQFGVHTYPQFSGSSYTDTNITNNPTYPGLQIISDEYDGTSYYNEDQGQRATAAQLWTQADTSFQTLIQIVGAGENGATIWDGVDNFYEYYQQWSAHGLISYDWTAPDPTAQSDYGVTPRLYANAQMFQFVGAGSVVIGSSTNASNFIEVAFRNPNGQISIVGENTGTKSQTITGSLTGGLAVSLFNAYFTNSSLSEQQQPNVAVSNGSFTFTVPADTIFTLNSPPNAPAVSSVSPNAGLTTGGQSVTITGSGFTGATGVSFGGVAAGSFIINSDTKITAITPAGSAGTVDVTIATPSANSTTSTADQFQYIAVNGTDPPTVANAAGATVAGNGRSALLTVLGASQYGASGLTYLWATVGSPPATVVFSNNGGNSANSLTATFSRSGNYNFQVTITDPAGNSATSTVAVTVGPVATTLSVTPGSGTVPLSGALQYVGTAADQFGFPYTATPISWTVSGGGTIDTTGKFIAGSATGGPFTITASINTLTAAALVSVSSVVNLGPAGTAYRWSALTNATSNSNRVAAPTLNDGNLTNGIALTGASDDSANAYEAGGILWAASQSVTKVTFTNGAFNAASYDGVFDKNFALQTTTNGTTWTSVSGWTLSPAYQYNLAAAGGVTYTFTGPVLSALGVRVIGEVHSLSGNDSWFDSAAEVQAFGTGSASPAPAISGVSPASGGLAGGMSVTITGSNFTGATGVTFGGIPAGSFTVNSASQITAVAPSAAAGTADITVTSSNGSSLSIAADQFQYIAAPTISAGPGNLAVALGQPATFTVTASGTGSLTYQWQKLVNGTWTNINGATSNAFAIASTVATDAASYMVIVTNIGGSQTSSPATLTVILQPPAAPANLVPTAGNNQVSLSWSASAGAAGYQIYRGLSSGSETLFASPTGTLTTFVDNAATNGTTYYYQVTAVNAGGESPPSTEVWATPQVPPPAITGIAPGSGGLAGGTSITITGSSFTGSTGVLFGGLPAGSFTVNSDTQITALSPASANAGNVDLTITTPYGISAITAADQFSYLAAPTISGEPASLTVLVGQPASFTVTAAGAGTLTYQWQKLVSGAWSNINGATASTFTIASAASTDTNSYSVIVTNAGGGITSDPASLVVNIPPPSAPTAFSANAGNNQVSLSWATSAGATGYQIYRGTSSGGESLFASPSGTLTTFVDNSAVNGTTYYYQVTALNSGGESLPSAERSATPKLPVPTVTSLNPNSGVLSGGVSITITGTNFTGATGVFFGSVAATSFTVNSATQITAIAPAAAAAGSVDLTVTTPFATSATLPADQFTYVAAPTINTQPAGLTVTVGQPASFTVSASGTGTLTYQWQKLVSGTWTNINGANSSSYTINSAALTDAGSYQVLVTNAGGSTPSNPATLVVNIPPPAAPTALAATAGNAQVSLSWSASTGATGYRIYRGTTPGGEVLLATPSGTLTTFVDNSAANGTTYYYQVTALNSGGESLRSNEASATPRLPLPTISGINPASGALAGGTSVVITGTNFTAATSVHFGSLVAGSFTVNSATQITAIAPAASAAGMVDVTVTTGFGTSATLAADQFTYVAPPTISTGPANLVVTIGQSATFSVTAAGTGTLSYQWQKLVNSTWTNISGATARTYTIASVAATDAGSYRVIVSNIGGSATSGTATLTANVPAPAAPTGLSAIAGSSQVSLSWTASTGATSYKIYRSTTKGAEVLLASPTGTLTTYVDNTAVNGTTYYYQVTAVNAGGESPRSSEVSATPAALTNIARTGTAYRWYALTSATSNSNRTAAAGLNDNNLTTNVVLSNGGGDTASAYEAAGIIWTATHSITQVKFTNGSFNLNSDGVFAANFGLQYTTNGTTWLPVVGWTVTPSYAYNSSSAGNATYTFSGPALTVLGVRVVGQVHTSGSGNSWYDQATEVQVFGQ